MEAGTITMKLGVLINCPIRFVHLEDAPEQENSSDCGVFVCLNMRYLLLDRILRANSHQKVSMSLAGKRVDATSGRREMLKIIEGFRKEGVRRRSYVYSTFAFGFGPRLTRASQTKLKSIRATFKESSTHRIADYELFLLLFLRSCLHEHGVGSGLSYDDEVL